MEKFKFYRNISSVEYFSCTRKPVQKDYMEEKDSEDSDVDNDYK